MDVRLLAHGPDVTGESVLMARVFASVQEQLVLERNAEATAASCPRCMLRLLNPVLSIG